MKATNVRISMASVGATDKTHPAKLSIVIPTRIDYAIALGLGALALVLRLAFAASQPTEWDSVHYVRGLDDFDVTQDAPHAPGYWLYLVLGRVVRALTPLDNLESLQLVTSIASAAVVALGFLATRLVAGRVLALCAAAVLTTSPFLWFYGSIVSTKSVDALILTGLLFLAYRASKGSPHGLIACIALGLSGGIRQSAVVLFAPLVLYVVLRSARSFRHVVLCALAGAVAIAAWFVPMVLDHPGGLAPIRAESNALLDGALHETSILVGSPGADDNALHMSGVVLTAMLPLIPLLLLGLWPFRRRKRSSKRAVWLPLLLGAGPGFLEALVVHFGTPGYSLSFLPALIIGVFVLTAALPERRTVIAIVLLTFITCAFNVHRFVFSPTALPYQVADRSQVWLPGKYGSPYETTAQALRNADNDQLRYRAVADVFDPSKDVLVLVAGVGGERYRLLTHQLPDFTMHLVLNDVDIDQARGSRHTELRDHEIEIPEGGRAILVLSFLPEHLRPLLASGQLSEVALPTGPVVYALSPGTEAFGLSFKSGPLPPI